MCDSRIEKNNEGVSDWLKADVVKALQTLKPILWFNSYKVTPWQKDETYFRQIELEEASQRLYRFRDFFKVAFPQTVPMDGLIESPLVKLERLREELLKEYPELPADLWLKCDSDLPISGSIKARGGIYEVLVHAEKLALEAGLLTVNDNYSIFSSNKFKQFFSEYTIAVGSTGNLGLSIGIISAVLGFTVNVHMSSDAKQWKKDMLRKYGANVFEYKEDYSAAVEAGRKLSDADPKSYFVDDEHSKHLFLGYTVAAKRLESQLRAEGVTVDEEHPLYVYLPCGVGGGPGGVAYGLKSVFGNLVHCYFAEPTHSPCMLLGVGTQTHEAHSVQEIGIDNKTLADGLAVGRASGMVSRLMTPLLDGLYTVEDHQLLVWLKAVYRSENIKLEPSALAGLGGPLMLSSTQLGRSYLEREGQTEAFKNGTHIMWATGGQMVPQEDFEQWLK